VDLLDKLKEVKNSHFFSTVIFLLWGNLLVHTLNSFVWSTTKTLIGHWSLCDYHKKVCVSLCDEKFVWQKNRYFCQKMCGAAWTRTPDLPIVLRKILNSNLKHSATSSKPFIIRNFSSLASHWINLIIIRDILKKTFVKTSRKSEFYAEERTLFEKSKFLQEYSSLSRQVLANLLKFFD
jgi:hypothetical protein